MQLIDKVLGHNSDFEVIKMFMEQEQQQELNKALIKFNSLAPSITKEDLGENLKGDQYNYAKIEAIQEKIKAALFDSDLSYRFNQKIRNDIVTVQCIVQHVAGGSTSTTMSSKTQPTDDLVIEQQIATTSSYLKRYTLANGLGLIIKGQDSDGVNLPPKKSAINSEPKKSHAEVIKELKETIKPAATIEPEIKQDDSEIEAELDALESVWKTEVQQVTEDELKDLIQDDFLESESEVEKAERYMTEGNYTPKPCACVADVVIADEDKDESLVPYVHMNSKCKLDDIPHGYFCGGCPDCQGIKFCEETDAALKAERLNDQIEESLKDDSKEKDYSFEATPENTERYEVRTMLDERQKAIFHDALEEISVNGAVLDKRELEGFTIVIVDMEIKILTKILNDFEISAEVEKVKDFE